MIQTLLKFYLKSLTESKKSMVTVHEKY